MHVLQSRSSRPLLSLLATLVTFCGVKAHHQIEILEMHSKELTWNVRALLPHAPRYWPEAITTVICTFTQETSEEIHTTLRFDEEDLSLLS